MTAEFEQRAGVVAAGLRALGVEPRDRVALLMPNSREYVEAFLGIEAKPDRDGGEETLG